MPNGYCKSLGWAVAASMLGLAVPAQADADITWIRSDGIDAGTTCTRTAPCRTFQFAHDQTNPGGTINVLDDGEYGRFSITKSITVMAVGKIALIRQNFGYGINIEAAPTDKVVIQGLTIDGIDRSWDGVGVVQAGSVYIIDSTIKNSSYAVRNSTIFSTEPARAFVQRCNFLGNIYGAYAIGSGRIISVLDTLIDGSIRAGLRADSSSIIGVARTVLNAGLNAIITSSGGQVISIGPSNIVSGPGTFNATVPFN